MAQWRQHRSCKAEYNTVGSSHPHRQTAQGGHHQHRPELEPVGQGGRGEGRRLEHLRGGRQVAQAPQTDAQQGTERGALVHRWRWRRCHDRELVGLQRVVASDREQGLNARAEQAAVDQSHQLVKGHHGQPGAHANQGCPGE